jgi:hypothetical protein
MREEHKVRSLYSKEHVPCGTYGRERLSYELILQNILEVCELGLPGLTHTVAGCY